MRSIIVGVIAVSLLSVVWAGFVWAGGDFVRPVRFTFHADLSGAEQIPNPVETRTTGDARFRLDGETLHYVLRIRDGNNILSVAGAHIHCAERGANGPVAVFLAGAVPTGFDGDVEIRGSINESNIGATKGCGETLEDLVRAMIDGRTYVNVHGEENPPGVVRGQIQRSFRRSH